MSPDGVSVAPSPGAYAIQPASAKRLSIPVTEGAFTPSRLAISAGETTCDAPPRLWIAFR